MPCTLKVSIIGARNIPVMDRRTGLSDSYVVVKFGEQTKKTDVAKKSLNPSWNQSFKFEISDDSELLSNYVELRVWDLDVVSDDVIGMVLIDLYPVALAQAARSPGSTTVVDGFLPIWDSLNGRRGELNVKILVDFLGNANPLADSATSVAIHTSSVLPPSYMITSMFGTVEELLVAEDPEHHWAESFRASRTTNDSRISTLFSLTYKLRHLICKKAFDVGASHVLGYRVVIDLEGSNGDVVARAMGTAVEAAAISNDGGSGEISPEISQPILSPSIPSLNLASSSFGHLPYSIGGSMIAEDHLHLFAGTNLEKGGSGSVRPEILTLKEIPLAIIKRVGGIVLARSVKVLSSRYVRQTRDKYWSEIRKEVLNNAKSLGCSHVYGYSEHASVSGDVCIYTGIGTAADLYIDSGGLLTSSRGEECSIFHADERTNSARAKCNVCKEARVMDVFLSSGEMPAGLATSCKSSLVEARVCREKRKASGEAEAIQLSELLPFLDFQLQKQMITKINVAGMNAAFSFQTFMSISDQLVLLSASATGVKLPALPVPRNLTILHERLQGAMEEKEKAIFDRIQDVLYDLSESNREFVESSGDIRANISDSSCRYALRVTLPDSGMLGKSDDSSGHELSLASPVRTIVSARSVGSPLSSGSVQQLSALLVSPRIPESIHSDRTFVLSIEKLDDAEIVSIIYDKMMHLRDVRVRIITASKMPHSGLYSFRKNCRYVLGAKHINYDSVLGAENKQKALTSLFFSIHNTIASEISNAVSFQNQDSDGSVEVSSFRMYTRFPNSSRKHLQVFYSGLVETPPDGSEYKEEVAHDENYVFEMEGMEYADGHGNSHYINPNDVILNPSSVPSLSRGHFSFLGRLEQHFIRETHSVKVDGGTGDFSVLAIHECINVFKSHAALLGGNMIVSFKIVPLAVISFTQKDQAYFMVTISGDVIYCN